MTEQAAAGHLGNADYDSTVIIDFKGRADGGDSPI